MTLPGQSGIIPDHFLYIGELPVVGKHRIDWETDPPPNLAIELCSHYVNECDITSFTSVDDYLPYRVGELWILRQQTIALYQLQNDRYVSVQQSRFFADFDLNAIYLDCVQAAYQFGSEAIDRLSDRFPRRR